MDKYCHVANLEELEENEDNLNIPRYVDTSIPEKPVDISETIEKINKLKEDIVDDTSLVNHDLEELGLEYIK